MSPGIARIVEKLKNDFPDLTEEQIYSVLKFAFKTMEESFDSYEITSIYFPNLGTWKTNNKKIALYKNGLYNHLVYNREIMGDNTYNNKYSYYLKIKKLLSKVEANQSNAERNHRKQESYIRGYKKFYNNEV